jgi:RNA polymerase sigma-70 factor (ECF subfamily)
MPEPKPKRGPEDQSATIDLLHRWRQGDDAALEALMERLYADLRRQARVQLARERAGHTLEPTALVHEVFLRLGSYQQISWQGRAHFLAVASRAMRRVLVDHARRRNAAKRGAAPVRVTLTDVASPRESTEIDLIALNDALEKLEQKDPRQCRVVEMHYFGGLSYEEIAAVLGVSQPTVKRDWRVARLWLRRALAS